MNRALYMSAPKLTSSSGQIPPMNTDSYRKWRSYDTGTTTSRRRTVSAYPWTAGSHYSPISNDCVYKENLGSLSPLTAQVTSGGYDRPVNLFDIPTEGNLKNCRISPSEWLRHHCILASQKLRTDGILLRKNTANIINELDEKRKRSRREVDWLLGQRVSDLDFWQREINKEIDALLKMQDSMGEGKRALCRFIKCVDTLSHITKECLYEREKRQGIELVHDSAQQSLLDELALAQQCHSDAANLLCRASQQEGRNRATIHDLDKNHSEKHTAATIDLAASNTRETSRGVAYHKDVEKFDNTTSVEETWADYSNSKLEKARTERSESKGLLQFIETFLNSSNELLSKRWSQSNTELSANIMLIRNARHKTENSLSATIQEIFNFEKAITFLKEAIQDKVNPMKVATTRIDMRSHRPNMENCRDSAQGRMVQEVHELQDSIENLNEKLKGTENLMQELLERKSALEQDYAIKTNTLFIDQDKCIGMRRTFPGIVTTSKLV